MGEFQRRVGKDPQSLIKILRRSNGLKCFGEGLLLLGLLSVQVSVKDHRYVADEDAAERCHLDAVTAKPHQAVPLQLAQADKLRGEMLVEVDPELALDFGFDYHAMTQEAVDDRPA